MLEFFKYLVSKESPSYIISIKTVSYEQLNAVICKYAKKDKFIVATSLYTSTWISKTLAGPLNKEGLSTCEELSDIALIKEFDTYEQCKNSVDITSTYLNIMYNQLRKATIEPIKSVIYGLEEGDTVTHELTLSPFPAILLTVKHNGNLLGTISVQLNHVVYPIFVLNPRLHNYVQCIKDLNKGNLTTPRLESVLPLSMD